jgi:cystathionine gamma-lyase
LKSALILLIKIDKFSVSSLFTKASVFKLFSNDTFPFIYRSIVPPISTSTTFEIVQNGYRYSTYGNPSRDVLENCLASLDNAKHALTFASGMGAITAIVTTLQTADEIVTSRFFYGGTIRLLRDLTAKMGIKIKFVNFDDLKSVEKALNRNTKLVFVESPTNPLLKVSDIQAIAELVYSKSKALLAVDNTFQTAYFQRPLELGADIVVYSLTKFTNGHHDVVMGAVTTNDENFYELLNYYRISTGIVPSPSDCHMVVRSLKTLSLRMEKHSENSFYVAKCLSVHPNVEKVFHPSLKSHDNHEIALKQCYGHSGILSFYIKGGLEQSQNLLKSFKLILNAESLGGAQSTVSFPWLMSHIDLPESERLEAGVTENLIRISIGLEDLDDILDDIKQALEKIN